MEIFRIIMLFIVVALIIWLLVSNIRIVPQARAYVVERLGAYHGTWQVGLHFKIPLIDKIARKVSLKEKVIDFPPQPVITKDNVTMEIDTVVYFQITDPKLYTYGVESPMDAIENLTATTLRNIIGELELDESLTSREHINAKIRMVAMEKQMRAERERREAILIAEGEKKSKILIAEGQKEAAILQAEANKQTAIREAEGQAEAILMINQATADGLKLIKDAGADDAVIKLKSLEAFQKAADGQATKIIIPSEIQGLAGLAASFKEFIKD